MKTARQQSDQDNLVYVTNVILGKLLESETLTQYAANNTKDQFASSPDLHTELMSAFDAHAVGPSFEGAARRQSGFPIPSGQ